MSGRSGRRYRLLVRLAAAALAWETLWPRLWPAVTLAGAGLAVALLDVLPLLPAWLHAVLLIAFAAALLAALGWAATGLKRITRPAALRRLEEDSALVHRPLAAMEDRQCAGTGDPLARLLWQRHQAGLRAASQTLKLKLPAPGLARREPWGIRAGVLLLLVIALSVGGDAASERLGRAVQPGLGTSGPPAEGELWITPPAYTGQPPHFLKTGTAPLERPALPDGSTAVARATGVAGTPTLVLAGRRLEMAPIGSEGRGRAGAFTAQVVIDDGDSLSIEAAGREIARWSFTRTPDRPPSIHFAAPFKAMANGTFELAYTAHDDYPLRAVTAIVAPAMVPEPGAEPAAALRLPMPQSAGDAGVTSGRKRIDLAEQPWAGLPGTIVIEAEDAAGQTARTEAVEVILPERSFSHPVAQAVIAQRKRLLTEGEPARAPVAAALADIAGRPDDFAGDVIVALALSVSRARLAHDRAQTAVDSVRRLLWQTAVRLDEGEVPLALRAFEDARERLEAALRDNAPTAEIERLTDALQEALQAYLEAAANELALEGDLGSLSQAGDAALRASELTDLLELARRLARNGARDGARQLLADLQDLLADIRAGLQMSERRKLVREMRALLEELRSLTRRQQELLIETLARSQAEGQRSRRDKTAPDPDANAPADVIERQGALRRALGEAIARAAERMESLPPPLPEADQAMAGAAAALQSGRHGAAAKEQTRAVDALQQAAEALSTTLRDHLSGMPDWFGADGERGPGRHGDLFGRGPSAGSRGFARGRMEIPDEAGLRRAQELLDELRRRAGDQGRTPLELDYIERLLRRF